MPAKRIQPHGGELNSGNADTQWQPGQSGRTYTLGAEMLNLMHSWRKKTPADMHRILASPESTLAMRGAAIRLLQLAERPDMAQFEAYIDGQKNLDQLAKSGVDTGQIKRLRRSKEAREIELHDRSGEEFDRAVDRTHGKPMQAIRVDGGAEMVKRIIIEGIEPSALPPKTQ